MIWIGVISIYFDISKVAFQPVKPLRSGGIGTGDYDNDGLVDFIAGGFDAGYNYFFLLYRQNTSLTFVDVTNSVTFPGPSLPLGFASGPAIMADIDKNGALDLFYAGNGLANAYFQAGLSSTFFLNNSKFAPAGLAATSSASADFGDYDGDGYLDLLLIGYGIAFPLLHQLSTGGFTNVGGSVISPLALSDMANSWTAWRDVDNDGRLDFALIGTSTARLYRQNISGMFNNIWNTVSFGGYASIKPTSVNGCWTDFDGNGLADFAFLSDNNFPFLFAQQSVLNFINFNTPAWFPHGKIPNLKYGAILFGDYNGDLLTDLIVTGQLGNFASNFICYQLANHTFSADVSNSQQASNSSFFVASTSFQGATYSSAVFRDMNADDTSDFLVIGNPTVAAFRIYSQNPTTHQLTDTTYSHFADNNNLLPSFRYWSSFRWFDYDGNGLPDFVGLGRDIVTQAVTKFFRQNRTNAFCDITNSATFPGGPPLGMTNGVIQLADYNGDGKVDLFMTGIGAPASYFYLHSPIGVFTDENNIVTFPDLGTYNLQMLEYPSWEWADLDHNGLLDLCCLDSASSLTLSCGMSKPK